jgi:hypothetical protein
VECNLGERSEIGWMQGGGRFQSNKEEKVSIFITLQVFEEPLNFLWKSCILVIMLLMLAKAVL